jgi:hypothetical protein
MPGYFSYLARLAQRRVDGSLRLPLVARGGLIVGATKTGRKSELTLKIESTGARPGETVAIDERGDARVLGRNPEVSVDNMK